jgi:hypothetical protein
MAAYFFRGGVSGVGTASILRDFRVIPL